MDGYSAMAQEDIAMFVQNYGIKIKTMKLTKSLQKQRN